MRVFLTGGTGVLGRRVVPELVRRGHQVVALSRRHDKDEVLGRLGARPARVNLFDVPALVRAAEGADVLLHLATSIPTHARPKREHWEHNDEIRVKGTRALLEVAKAVGARRLVLQSVAWLGARADGGPIDERSPPHPDPLARSAARMEELALDEMRSGGPDATILRCGWFYAPDAAHTRTFADLLQRRRLPIVGRGTNRWSLLHVDDAARAFADAVEAPEAGLWHVVDDEPVEQAEFLRAFAERLEAPPPLRVPAWLAALGGGRDAAAFMTRGFPTSSDAFREATGWKPSFPTYREGLDQVVGAWREQGWRAGEAAAPTSPQVRHA